jgi:(1->4)-alpha-D-glucan 1-alpha-D-glucosylmutase
MTLQAIARALREFLVQLPVYRVYFRAGGRSAEDTAVIEGTVAAARATLRSPDQAVLEQLGRWLLADAATASPLLRRATIRFEHLTPPLAAKSIEDTAFYRYGRLLSRNEVGSGGSAFALDVEDFHRLAERRAATFPHAMLAVSTHDHKRGADLRARLAVLSERPEQWAQTVARWRALNAAHRRPEPAPTGEVAEAEAAEDEATGAETPEPADELMLYQMLVGAWPPTLGAEDRDGLERWAERIAAWQQKALREAQRRSSWAQPDTDYEEACERFLRRILGLDEAVAGHEATFLQALAGFVGAIAPAGALNGLTQAALHLTTPGVPDLYQGCEQWDFSLVDPDNRRAVDFAAGAEDRADPGALPALAAAWQDGAVKRALIGSVASAVARGASCPVLLVPPAMWSAEPAGAGQG